VTPLPPEADLTTPLDGHRALVQRLRAGDREAFDEIFRQSYPMLVRLATGMLHDVALAEDIAQEVMLELWRRREQLDPHGSPLAYLYQATRNRALNQLRGHRVRQRLAPLLAQDPAREASAPSLVVAQELDAAFRGAVATMSPRCREVFELSRGRGLTYSEIASTLGVSVKAVEAQMGKALRLLREHLAPWLNETGLP